MIPTLIAMAICLVCLVLIPIVICSDGPLSGKKKPVINGIQVCPGQQYQITGMNGTVTVWMIGMYSTYYRSDVDKPGYGREYFDAEHDVFAKSATLIKSAT